MQSLWRLGRSLVPTFSGSARSQPGQTLYGRMIGLGASTSSMRVSPQSFSFSSLPDEYNDRVIRFQDGEGNMSFGVFVEGKNQQYARRIRPNSSPMRSHELEDEEVEVANILPPIDPAVIYGIGLNYRKHAEETGISPNDFPVVFMKSITSVVGHQQGVVIPKIANEKPEVDYEVELAVVIGKEAKDVSKDEALDYVLGYTVANDVTARRWQGKKGGGQWVYSKSFDTFCPLGPSVVPTKKVEDPQNLGIRFYLNDELMQEGNTGDMMFTVADLVSFLSQGTTLLPGTVILTGTPPGVGFKRDPPRYLKKGDVMRCEIDGIGQLTNRVGEEHDLGVQF
eukprot:gb/GECG01000137.1/.p1 GENE.gb/GECG01000137.1/~~gb/GECG01000137.1/.p1  ORF type:complete len:338 (+),score=40.25 gb/GECG01000137.1/:1-1014(+)